VGPILALEGVSKAYQRGHHPVCAVRRADRSVVRRADRVVTVADEEVL